MKNITFVFNSHFTTSICNIENYFSQVCDNKENHKLLSKNESAKKNYDTRKQNFPCFSSRSTKFSASQMKELSTLFFTSELAKISHGSTASNQQVGKRPYASRFPDPPPCFPLLFSCLSFFFCFFLSAVSSPLYHRDPFLCLCRSNGLKSLQRQLPNVRFHPYYYRMLSLAACN